MPAPALSTPALQAMNCSAQHFVAVVGSWLASVAEASSSSSPSSSSSSPPSSLSFSYAFHHSPPSPGEVAAAAQAATEAQAQCGDVPRLSCGGLVEAEATVGA